jgi:hypothetical protein
MARAKRYPTYLRTTTDAQVKRRIFYDELDRNQVRLGAVEAGVDQLMHSDVFRDASTETSASPQEKKEEQPIATAVDTDTGPTKESDASKVINEDEGEGGGEEEEEEGEEAEEGGDEDEDEELSYVFCHPEARLDLPTLS